MGRARCAATSPPTAWVRRSSSSSSPRSPPRGRRPRPDRDPRGAVMRVLLVNAFHYLRGGVERTYFDEARWLTAAGHEVAHLSTHDARNLPSPTAHLFAPGADYGERVPATQEPSRWTRVLWSRPAAAAMRSVIEE